MFCVYVGTRMCVFGLTLGQKGGDKNSNAPRRINTTRYGQQFSLAAEISEPRTKFHLSCVYY